MYLEIDEDAVENGAQWVNPTRKRIFADFLQDKANKFMCGS